MMRERPELPIIRLAADTLLIVQSREHRKPVHKQRKALLVPANYTEVRPLSADAPFSFLKDREVVTSLT
jgi:hypothetical protein